MWICSICHIFTRNVIFVDSIIQVIEQGFISFYVPFLIIFRKLDKEVCSVLIRKVWILGEDWVHAGRIWVRRVRDGSVSWLGGVCGLCVISLGAVGIGGVGSVGGVGAVGLVGLGAVGGIGGVGLIGVSGVGLGGDCGIIDRAIGRLISIGVVAGRKHHVMRWRSSQILIRIKDILLDCYW